MNLSFKTRRGIVAGICATAVITALTLYSQQQASGRAKEVKPGQDGARAVPSMTVRVLSPEQTVFDRAIAATGTVNARDELVIGSDAAGVRLMEVLVDVGSLVQKGQLLARGDDAQLLAQLAQQVAQVKQAQAEHVQAEANLERAENLKDSGVYSTETVQTRRTAAASAAAKLELAEAQRRELEVKISHTRVVAPAAGVIARRAATVGAVVQAGTELFRLIKDGELEWRAELPGHSLARIQAGSPVRILLDSGNAIEAKVRLVAPTIDAATRNGQVHVQLPQGVRLKAGGHARGEILIDNAQALALPEASVLTRDGYPFVYVVGADGIARLTKIETGSRQRGLVEVSAGLKPDARVVATGAGFVKDGDLVQVAPTPTANTRKPATGGQS
jgi:RND family efflux transporter MFP subunit